MTRTVRDDALLLEAIAGQDGIDDRQPAMVAPESLHFSTNLESFFAYQPKNRPLQGLRVGVLREGFAVPMMNADVAAVVRSSVTDLGALRAEVVDISIPEHEDMPTLWSCILPFAGGREGFLGAATGREGYNITSRYTGQTQKSLRRLLIHTGLGPAALSCDTCK